MQCECPGCVSCKVVCDGSCEGTDEGGICGCDCANEGRIRTEYGFLCADCYDYYDSPLGFFDE